MPELPSVAVLGAGSWGTALALLLGKKEVQVALWARDAELAETLRREGQNPRYLPGFPLPVSVHPTSDIAEAVHAAQVLVFAVPAGALREVASAVGKHLSSPRLVISAAKGLESDGSRPSQVLQTTLGECCAQIVALSGPNLALELAREIPTATVVASTSSEAAKQAQALFMHPSFRVYTNRDVTGVELGGALKNVLAIGAGISDGMGFGDNSKAAFITRGLAEMVRLGVALGAEERTFMGLSGVGDLFATASSHLSRNWRVGHGLAQGKPLVQILQELRQVAEGVPTTFAVCTLAERLGIEMPIAQTIRAVLDGRLNPREAIHELMLRTPKDEWWGGR
ncbi:MAG: NAD(P)H-dependent glycerol-3-phosphate dehydrogenase [Armatimonadota bacterium]|nr:NAD(P)-dependent glycerol-3-phosphate dehydrogenase [bacterium]MDW8320354.1 NAD(P)H-dependent glycerol-3-phosphate dehydrogenase [Armatimonadota bacterium]